MRRRENKVCPEKFAGIIQNDNEIFPRKFAPPKNNPWDLQSALTVEKPLPEVNPEQEQVQANHGAAHALFKRAMDHYKNKQYSEAIQLFTRSIFFEELHGLSNFDAYYCRALAYVECGEHELAFVDFEYLEQRHPNSAELYYGWGSSLYQLGKFKEAKPFLSNAVRLDPTFVKARLMRGDIYVRNHERELAVLDFETVLKLDSKNDKAKKALDQINNPTGHHKRTQEKTRYTIFDRTPKQAASAANEENQHCCFIC